MRLVWEAWGGLPPTNYPPVNFDTMSTSLWQPEALRKFSRPTCVELVRAEWQGAHVLQAAKSGRASEFQSSPSVGSAQEVDIHEEVEGAKLERSRFLRSRGCHGLDCGGVRSCRSFLSCLLVLF